jgi:ferredoxin
VKVAVDQGLCIASGECALAAPDLFAQDAAGIAYTKADTVPDGREDVAEEAMHACPAAAIRAER